MEHFFCICDSFLLYSGLPESVLSELKTRNRRMRKNGFWIDAKNKVFVKKRIWSFYNEHSIFNKIC